MIEWRKKIMKLFFFNIRRKPINFWEKKRNLKYDLYKLCFYILFIEWFNKLYVFNPILPLLSKTKKKAHIYFLKRLVENSMNWFIAYILYLWVHTELYNIENTFSLTALLKYWGWTCSFPDIYSKCVFITL